MLIEIDNNVYATIIDALGDCRDVATSKNCPSYVIDAIDEALAALTTPEPVGLAMPDWLDFPDSVGYWAFEGEEQIVSGWKSQEVYHFVEWGTMEGGDIAVYRIAGERYPTHFRPDWFRERYNGKWRKLDIAWQRPQP